MDPRDTCHSTIPVLQMGEWEMCIAAGTPMCTLAIRDHFYYRLGLGRGYTQTARGDRRECALQGRNHGTKQLKFNIFHIEGARRETQTDPRTGVCFNRWLTVE